MDLVIVGPGRAGMSLALRAADAAHDVVAVVGRDEEAVRSAAWRLDATPLSIGDDLPTCDLLVLAVRDDAIGPVASSLGSLPESVPRAIHVSGLTPVAALQPLLPAEIGSFHPLQTLPDPEAGRSRLPGAWVAVTSEVDELVDRLFSLARSLGLYPFEVADEDKALYHAAAAAAANYPLAAMAMAEELFAAAGIPFEAAAPLVRAVVDNALEMGPRSALTGPIARGDIGTVAAQMAAIRGSAPAWADHFAAMGRVTAAVAGTDMEEALG